MESLLSKSKGINIYLYNNELSLIVWQQVFNLLNKRTFKQSKHC